MKPTLQTRLAVEFIGTGLLVTAVIGSGIMAERLSSGNIGLALLANSIATGAALVTLILTFGQSLAPTSILSCLAPTRSIEE